MYGTIPKRVSNISSISKYSLDGGSVEGTFAPLPSDNVHFQQKFFVSRELPNGPHQLHILDTISSDGLWLDFFVITTGLDPSNFSASSSSISGFTQTIQSPSQVTETARPTSKPASNSWVIAVSLAIGGCAMLVAAILTVHSLRRWRQSQREVHAVRDPEPFVGKYLII